MICTSFILFLQQAFSLSPKVTLDHRTHIMNLIKTIPLDLVITYIYPKLYGVHNLTEKVTVLCNLTTYNSIKMQNIIAGLHVGYKC